MFEWVISNGLLFVFPYLIILYFIIVGGLTLLIIGIGGCLLAKALGTPCSLKDILLFRI